MATFPNPPFHPNQDPFNSSQPDHNKNNAYWMARICQMTNEYKKGKNKLPNTKRIKKELRNAGFKVIDIEGYSHKSSQAILIECDNFVCIAYRATEAVWSDIMDCVVFIKIKAVFDELFHKGFYKATKDVLECRDDDSGIWEDYKEIQKKNPSQPLFITGHSLGGAMATVTMAICADKGVEATCYTFGQPRVMSQSASNHMDNMSMGKNKNQCKNYFLRVEINGDPVTRIPCITDYKHVGTLVCLDKQGKSVSTPYVSGKLKSCIRAAGWILGSAVNWLSKKVLNIRIIPSKHAIAKYIAAIDKWDGHI